jgi:hypothetical protein
MLQLNESLQKSQICFNQVSTIKFVKMYNLDLEIWERQTCME